MISRPRKVAWIFLVLLIFFHSGCLLPAQPVFVVDQFNPAGADGDSYQNGGITNVWANWFGDAFESLAWDSTSDVSNNPNSGSLKITALFNSSDGNSQFAVYDFNGIYPPVNGAQYTNFQCDVRFAPGSATVLYNGSFTFGYLQFGVEDGYNQDYFGGVIVPATNTNWVHISLPINAASDENLSNIYNVIIHIYSPYLYPGLNGASTLWVDNIQFTGAATPTTNCVVNWNDLHQRIDGFGASSAFLPTWTQAQANMFFSTNPGVAASRDGTTNFNFNGIGLSLLRSRIAPGGTTTESSIMQMAQTLGATVWSTPWSPAANFKTGSNPSVNGGNFNSADYQTYANQLAGYVVNMKNQYGVNIYAISVQNEPDVSTTYESCLWTAQQIHDFVPYLAGALAASNVASTKIILAEDENWQTNLYYAAMSDSAVASNVSIVACHNYDGNPPSNIPAQLSTYDNTNAALWETEVSAYNPYDPSITNALYWAERIHLFMTVAQVNAFHFWWLMSDNPDNEGLTSTNGIPAARMYALGNFSRFVRPGYYRIGVTNNGFTSVSAYKNPANNNFAIVAINSSSSTVTQIFNLANFTATLITPWITSATNNLVAQPPFGVTNSSFSYGLPPMSIVTFTGQGYVIPSSIAISSVALTGNGVVLTWNSVAGAIYSVLRTNVLGAPASAWPVEVSGYPKGGAPGGPISFTDTVHPGNTNFYRVRSP